MVGVLELNAFSNLLSIGGRLAFYIQQGYYEGTAACSGFPGQIDLLTKKHEEWRKQLQEHGMAEDPIINSLLESAAKSLKEEETRVQKIRGSRWKKVKIMAFPDQLTLNLKLIIDRIEAGPKLVASSVENFDALRKRVAQSPSVLPISPDRKYVLIPSAVEKVRNALEDFSGPRVVTISGMPGLGKTGLAKHIALFYYEQLRQPLSQPCFPNGVHFFPCGKGADEQVRGLKGLLLQSLGYEDPQESSSWQIQERGDSILLESYNIKLCKCLVNKKALIIFDDVWETQLVENLINPGPGVKYLITSQIKDIWTDALNVELENPDMDQAMKIMARNTKGLSPPYEFADCVKKEVEGIIRKLHFHPLSIANVAVSIDHKSNDPEAWKEVKENIHAQLKESALHPNPLLYDKRYPLSVAASMMLMVRSLEQYPRELLFVIVLCDSNDDHDVRTEIPEAIVKYFFQFVQPLLVSYRSSKQYLESRSIIESHELHNRAHLTMHGLRRDFIREEKTDDLSSTAARILSKTINRMASGNSDANVPSALRLLLAAVYFRKLEKFREVILQTTIHDAPWISSGKQALDLLDLAERGGRDLRRDLLYINLLPLLNVFSQAGGWEREAHDSASKILHRWICREDLDDEGSARLLELPRTTSRACTALQHIFRRFETRAAFDRAFWRPNPCPKTMKILKDLVHNNAVEPSQRAEAVRALGAVAQNETEETIIALAEKWAQLLTDNSTPGIQYAAASVLLSSYRLKLIMGECEVLLEVLLDNLKSTEESDNSSFSRLLDKFCKFKEIAVRIANIPGALERILAAFVSDEGPALIIGDNYTISSDGFDHRLKALLSLSSFGENKMKFVPVLSSLLQVVETLLPVDPKHWYTSPYLSSVFAIWGECAFIGDMLNAARIVGNLGLVTEIRDNILARPSIRRGLLDLLEGRSERDQLDMFKSGGELCDFPSRVAARTLTILGVPYEVKSTSSALSPLEGSAGPCALMYMGRAEAKEELGLFSEALGDLRTALDYISQVIRLNPEVVELRSDNSMEKCIEKLFTVFSWKYGPRSVDVRVRILSSSKLLKSKIEKYQDAVKGVDNFLEMFPEVHHRITVGEWIRDKVMSSDTSYQRKNFAFDLFDDKNRNGRSLTADVF